MSAGFANESFIHDVEFLRRISADFLYGHPENQARLNAIADSLEGGAHDWDSCADCGEPADHGTEHTRGVGADFERLCNNCASVEE